MNQRLFLTPPWPLWEWSAVSRLQLHGLAVAQQSK